tara:strand:- start:22 stop:306 length:285 start_codon:yes stop_codon:yes gene_type:complete
MNKILTKQKLPKWFNGELYEEGETVTNPFSGESYELNNIELSMYDFIIGAQHVFGIHQEKQPNKPINVKLINDFDKALYWFRTNNAEAYMVLLD